MDTVMVINFEPDEEARLIELCKKDITNFKSLYERYVDRLYSYTLSRCHGNEDIAMDIVSDTFTKAIENIQKYTFTGRPFIAWLYTISHNLIVDSYKQKTAYSIDELEIEPKEEVEGILDKLGDEELRTIIKEELKKLPADLQNILILRNEEDLSFAQIADLLKENEGAIKMRYYRTVELLKNTLIAEKPDLKSYMGVLLMFMFI